MKNTIHLYRFLEKTVSLTMIVLLIYQLFSVGKILKSIMSRKSPAVFAEPGIEYIDFKPLLKGIHRVGFLTNKNTSAEHNDGQFLKAQYMLAPVVLELRDENQSLLVIDPTSLIPAFDIMQRLNAVPILVNPYGKVLAQKK